MRVPAVVMLLTPVMLDDEEPGCDDEVESR